MAMTPGVRMHSSEAINAAAACGMRVAVPLTGDIVTLGNEDTVLYVNPAGTIATLTVRLPSVAGQAPGKEVCISFSQVVTALTITDMAGATTVASTAGAIATGQEYRYVSAAIGWVRWR